MPVPLLGIAQALAAVGTGVVAFRNFGRVEEQMREYAQQGYGFTFDAEANLVAVPPDGGRATRFTTKPDFTLSDEWAQYTTYELPEGWDDWEPAF